MYALLKMQQQAKGGDIVVQHSNLNEQTEHSRVRDGDTLDAVADDLCDAVRRRVELGVVEDRVELRRVAHERPVPLQQLQCHVQGVA